jgi:hypothetical protein
VVLNSAASSVQFTNSFWSRATSEPAVGWFTTPLEPLRVSAMSR